MSYTQFDRIKNDIVNSYQNIDSPNFSCIQSRYQSNPYFSLRNELNLHFKVINNTDLNYDVCIDLFLTKGNRELSLQLSLIGNYSVVMRINKSGKKIELLNNEMDAKNKEEHLIFELLSKNGLDVLEEKILKQEIRFSQPELNSDSALIYQVLFSFEDCLPWEF